MSAPIALQLYTVREAMADDAEGVIRKVADLGYVGVETAGFPGTTPEDAAKLFQELGLEVCSAHMPLPVGEKKQEVLDTMATIGCTRLISGFGRDQYATLAGTKEACDKFNEASAVAVENGLTFGIHNHWWEFQEAEGQLVYKAMLEHLSPDVFFEIDTYWVQTGGCDPVEVVKEMGARAPLLHIKDGPCDQKADMTAIGEGKVDFPAIVKAAGDNTKWMIVELDRCATDMMDAVVKSYSYLTSNELATGKKS